MPFPTAIGYRKYMLTFEVDGATEGSYEDLVTYEVLSYSGSPFMLNNYPYRKYGSDEQGAKGDGTLIIPNLAFEVRGVGDPLMVNRTIYREMQFTKRLRLDTYNVSGVLEFSYRVLVASPVGVVKLERLTLDTFRAEIEFITATAYWERLGTPDQLIGVI